MYKKEVEEYIKGFAIKDIKFNMGDWECSFENGNGEILNFCIAVTKNTLFLSKRGANFIERVKIDGGLFLIREVIEKRSNGIIYSIITKRFDFSNKFKNALVLADLIEQRFVFSKKTLESLLNNFDFDNTKLGVLLLKLRRLEKKSECDYFTEFSTHMNNCVILTNDKKNSDNTYSTRTYLNGDEVSAIFDINDGEDKLYRIYDLYHGIINPRNENEIYTINLGILTSDSYDLKTLRGITDMEDSIVGKSSTSGDEKYLNYLKEMLYRKTGFKGNLELNRDSILSAITYKISSPELIKRQIEEKLSTSYEEFEKMDESTIFDSKRILKRLLRLFKKVN